MGGPESRTTTRHRNDPLPRQNEPGPTKGRNTPKVSYLGSGISEDKIACVTVSVSYLPGCCQCRESSSELRARLSNNIDMGIGKAIFDAGGTASEAVPQSSILIYRYIPRHTRFSKATMPCPKKGARLQTRRLRGLYGPGT